jgi:cytidylate kinase
MIILVCGATASGKTKTVKFLSKKYNLKPIFTSSILKDISSGKLRLNSNYKNLKQKDKQKIDNLRNKSDSLDLKLDKYLLNLIKHKDNLIFDSWTLPYLTKKGIKIWLKADASERARRFALRENVSYNEAVRDIEKKDLFSKKKFKKLYNIDFKDNLNVFDLILDTNNKSIKEVYNEICKYIDNNFKK